MSIAEVTSEQVCVLLVDDDVGVADMYSLQLRTTGYGVITAQSGERALELARAEVPDLILLDLGLPQISGLEVLERLHADPETASIPVLVLSNFSEPELIEQSIRLGAREYLVKSHTTPGKLAEALRRWTGESG